MMIPLIVKRRTSVFVVIIILSAGLVLSCVGTVMSLRERRDIGKILNINDLYNKKTAMEKTLRELSDKTRVDYSKKLPAKVDPLEFKQRLIDTLTKLDEKAKAGGLTLPESLGFDEYKDSMPKPGEIATLSIKLDVLSELVAMMITSKVSKLESIDYIKQPDLSGGKPDGELEMDIVVDCRTGDLVRFLALLNASQFYLSAGVRQTEAAADRVKAKITLSSKNIN